MRLTTLVTYCGVAALTAACNDGSRTPAGPAAPAFDAAAPAACPTPATLLVSDEAGLLAALAAANPGDVIGLNGTIALTGSLTVGKSVTLTCVTPGSGLAVASGSSVDYLIQVTAPFVAVERLVLDASGASQGPYFAYNDGGANAAANPRLTNNVVTCGPANCAFIVGVPGPQVTDNYFTSNGSVTGVHIQSFGLTSGSPDSARVERNTIVATAPEGVPFGAIRVVGGAGVVIADNVVSGPWFNSILVARNSGIVVQGNRLEGARRYGINTSVAAAGVVLRDGSIANNIVHDAGLGGIFLSDACSNQLTGNNLQGNANDRGALFSVRTGDNHFFGNGTLVLDDGSFDCDHDGVADPNIITGQGALGHGVNVDPSGDAVMAGDIHVQ